MTIDEMRAIMDENSGWSLHSHSGDNNSFDYVYEEYPIHCQVYPGSNEFEFIYVTRRFFSLRSGIIGSFDNRDHFIRRFIHFKSEADLLEYR